MDFETISSGWVYKSQIGQNWVQIPASHGIHQAT